MLGKFEVSHFKNFTKMSLDLTKTNSYEFNNSCVKNSIVNKALVYGHNGVGKSNLGFAIFDLVSHLTDKNLNRSNYTNYLNAYSKSPFAEFSYTFIFDENIVEYNYRKIDLETILFEEIKINGQLFASVDRAISNIATFKAEGAENLVSDLGDSKISIVSYIEKNTVLKPTNTNLIFYRFIAFVNGMLFFRSLEQNNYIGFEQGSSSLAGSIIENGNVKHFEEFLNKNEINCKLDVIPNGDKKELAFDFGDRKIPFFEIASQGTKSLTLFYYWYQKLVGDSKVTFLYVDEFDAFYHHTLSGAIIDLIKDIKAQAIMTSHNTSVMSNDLMRPDCYFLMYQDKVDSLANSTPKALREAHNIEKMYKAGSFRGYRGN